VLSLKLQPRCCPSREEESSRMHHFRSRLCTRVRPLHPRTPRSSAGIERILSPHSSLQSRNHKAPVLCRKTNHKAKHNRLVLPLLSRPSSPQPALVLFGIEPPVYVCRTIDFNKSRKYNSLELCYKHKCKFDLFPQLQAHRE